MKKISLYIVMITCAILFAGCQKDFDGVFTAEIQNYNNGNGKAYIDDENFACWNDGDGVGVIENDEWNFNPMVPYLQEINVVNNIATIDLGFTLTRGDDIWMYYPYNRDNMLSIDPKSIDVVEIKNKQDYQEINGVQKIDAPMVAHAKLGEGDNVLKFYNLASLLKINITNNSNVDIDINSIKLSDISNPQDPQKLAGRITYTQEVNSIPTIINNNLDKLEINLCKYQKNGVSLVSTGEAMQTINASSTSVPFYIYIAPDLECKYQITIKGTGIKDGVEQPFTKTVSFKNPITIKQNTIVTVNVTI